MTDIQGVYFNWRKVSLIFAILFALTGCDQGPAAVISVKAVYQDKVLGCDDSFERHNKTWRYQQLQFFISDIEVNLATDTTFENTEDLNKHLNKHLKKNLSKDVEKQQWQSWQMLETPYQSDNVALLGQVCSPVHSGENVSRSKQKTSAGNWQLRLAPLITDARPKKIRFTLGIPLTLNHQNPLSQNSPLNDPVMFWVWRRGHKFLRLDLQSENDHWLFHLGSTGCIAPSSLRAPSQECRQPNRVKIELPFNGEQSTFTFDLSVLLHQVALGQASGCQSAPDDANCQQLFTNLSESESGQVLFRGLGDE